MTTTMDAIKNLETISTQLEKLANSPSNYNTSFGQYLEQYAWEMFRMKNEIQSYADRFGIMNHSLED